MKKITLLLTGCLISGISLASGKFTSSNGLFVVPNVNVDNRIFFDSVTLQLNLNNGSFKIVNTQLKPSESPENPEAGMDQNQQNEFIAVHNKWRAEVGTPTIKWSATLATTAQGWANNLKGRGCVMEHSTTNLGENLYWASETRSEAGATAQAITPTQVTDAWGNEKQDYSYDTNTCAAGKQCGHYTQVVWKTTTEVGCAMAICDDKSQVWVCNYSPAGNFTGQKPY